MLLIKTINNILRKFGAEIVRFPKGDLKRRVKMMNHNKIDLIIDVGANKGEYTSELINLGYKGAVESFEPVREVYTKLVKESKNHKQWNAHNIALGNFDGETEINIAGNINSSSLLNMLPKHEQSAPNSKYVRKENILVKKLDSIFTTLLNNNSKVFLKIDVQGYEMEILKGAEICLKNIQGIQIEMSLESLYEGSVLYKEMIKYLEEKGFELYSIENGFTDPLSGKLLQCDGIFFKKQNEL